MSTSIKSLQNLCIAYISVWAISPPLTVSSFARALAVAATGVWFLLEIIRGGNIFKAPTVPAIVATTYLIYTLTIIYVTGGFSEVVRNIQIAIMLLFIYFQQSRRDDAVSLYPIFWFVLLVLPIWQLVTINALLSGDSHAARIAVRGSEEAVALARGGVGGYVLVYGSLLGVPALISLLLRPQQIDLRGLFPGARLVPFIGPVILITNLVLAATLILLAGYTIAAIILFVVVLSITILKNYSSIRILIVLSIGMFGVVFATEIVEFTLTSIRPLAEGTNFSTKIQDILLSLRAEESVGTLNLRMQRYDRSIEAFSQNPVFGNLSSSGLGGHSKILDDFAQFGMFIGIIFIYLTTFLQIAYMRRIKLGFGAPLATLLVAVLTFGLNTAFAMVGVMLYIIFPVAMNMLDAEHDLRHSRRRLQHA